MATQFKACSVDGCNGNAHWTASGSRGWCRKHWDRWRAHGDPLAGRIQRGEYERYFRDVVMTYEGDECLPWPYAKNEHGYGRMNGCLASRRVCEEANGPPPTPSHEAAHSCGKGHLGCVTKRHLVWKTHAENQADKISHGTSPRGERHVCAKLTGDDVRTIRSLHRRHPQNAIARRFGISQQSVSDIQTRRSWGWLE